MLRALVIITLLLLNIGIALSDTQTAIPAARKAVLVTGASSGIGRKITERLAADGYFVYAGARKDADLRALNAIAHVQGVRLDVTSAADIVAAVDVVTKAGRDLYGLVNNAGIATLGPIVGGDEREFDQVMAVNVHGPYRVTRAFAPMIIAEKGRITTIGSLNGIVATGNVGAYSMSKHAVEAFADARAQELGPLGVSVSILSRAPSARRLPGTRMNVSARRVRWTSPIFRSPTRLRPPWCTRCLVPNQSAVTWWYRMTARRESRSAGILNGWYS